MSFTPSEDNVSKISLLVSSDLKNENTKTIQLSDQKRRVFQKIEDKETSHTTCNNRSCHLKNSLCAECCHKLCTSYSI